MSEKDYFVEEEEEFVGQPYDEEDEASKEASRSLPEKPVGEVVEQHGAAPFLCSHHQFQDYR